MTPEKHYEEAGRLRPMTAKKVEIKLDGPGHGSLKVDGVEHSKGVTGFHIDAQATGETRLALEVIVVELQVYGEMKVYIKPETHDLLVALGWTPPKENS